MPGLISNIASNAVSNAINKFKRRISGNGAAKVGEGFTLFMPNKDTDDIIKTVRLLEDSEVLIDGVTKVVKHEIKKQEGGFLAALLASLAASAFQPVISTVVKAIAGRRVMRTGRGYNNMD